MATNLLDTIKKNMAPQEPVAPALGQTQAVQRLLQAKRGKAAAPTAGPAASSMQERIMGQQVRAGQQQLQTQAAISQAQQEEQAADITQREEIQKAGFEQQLKAGQQQLERQTTNILNDLSRGEKQLAGKEYVSKINQITAGLRLSNDQYIFGLQDAGRRARLDTDLGFKEAAYREIMAAELDYLRDEQKFTAMMNADTREFQEEVAKMDINAALDIANVNTQTMNTQAKYEGASQMISAGTQIVAKGAEKGWFTTDDSTGGSTS